MLRYLPLIVKNSWRNRRRSFLTIGSMAISFCLLGALTAIYQAFYFGEPTPEQALRLVTRNRVSPAVFMPIAYRDRILKVPGVRDVSPCQWFGGIYKEPRNVFARYGVEPERILAARPELRMPEDQRRAFVRERTACLIGRGLAERYQLKLGDRVTLKGDIFPVTLELTVRAIYDYPNDNDLLFFNLDYLYSLHKTWKDRVVVFTVLADTPESVPRIAREVDDLFRNSTAETRTEPERSFQLGFLSLLGNVKAFMLSVCAALTFTVLLVSANTMAMSVRERTREVGVLKTLGFSRYAILGMILGEAAFLSLVGGLIGCVFAYGLTQVVQRLPAIIIHLSSVKLEPITVMLLLAVSMTIGVFSSLIPAINAARTPILAALKEID